jgi:hypothetical protein
LAYPEQALPELGFLDQIDGPSRLELPELRPEAVAEGRTTLVQAGAAVEPVV